MINIVEELKKRNIRAMPYRRAPFGEGVFALTIDDDHPEGTIKIHPGQAKIEFHGSKKLRQATLTVREGGRVITRNVMVSQSYNKRPSKDAAAALLPPHFPVTMPPETAFSTDKVTIELFPKVQTGEYKSYRIKGVVTATVADPTVNHFLMGMDESHNFICALPKKPKSVRHAHRILRPHTPMGNNWIRQGEFFFVPVESELTRRLNRMAHNYKLLHTERLRHSHHAQQAITWRGDTYAIGYIVDRRKGHHKSLHLKGWHKVVQNRETEVKISKAQRNAIGARRNRSWD